MYIIVVGAGDIGIQVIDILVAAESDIVVIESDQHIAEQVSQQYDCLVLNADATVKETLVEAGAERADAIITTTDVDATNMMALMIAQELSIPSLVSTVQNPDHMSLFRKIGANALQNPQQLIAEYLVRAVQRPSIKDFMHLRGDAEVFEILVSSGAPIAELTIEEANERGLIGDTLLIVAIERDGGILTPRGDTIIQIDDLVTVFSREGATASVVEEFSG